MYARSRVACGDARFPLCLVLVYEAFHQHLSQELPNSTILAYVDDIAIISPNERETQQVVECVSELSGTLGLKTNSAKTQV